MTSDFEQKTVMNENSDSRELILIVDDEPDIRALLKILFEKEGWQVAEAANGREAVSYAERNPGVSLVIMDIMMPVMNGFEAAEQLRTLIDAPILFLTARSSDHDKMSAYRSGADDYIVKPFHATDLRLKVRAMLTRYRLYRAKLNEQNRDEDKDQVLSPAEGIEVYPEERYVLKNGERVTLTEREYELLYYFCCHRKKTLSPAEIYEAVWGEPYLNTASNTVIVHVANLRRKLESGLSGQSFIRTVWGKGYRVD